MTFEPARPGDAAAILKIFKATFDERLIPCTFLGCDGAEVFLEDTISSAFSNLDTTWVVARDSAVRGFAGVRIYASGVFLNYLHVDPAFHGQKIGSKLFLRAMETLDSDCIQPIHLDVAEDNGRAKAWYQRLGFAEKEIATWKLFPLQKISPEPKFVISGIPHAEVMHKLYGFSTLTIHVGSASFEVGRLGKSYFRSSDPRILDCLPILREIDSKRELLHISTESPAGGREISRRVRMTAELPTLLKNLRQK